MIVATQDSGCADDDKVLCVIRDMTDPSVSTRFNINLQASCSCQLLVEEVAKNCGYQTGTFCLTYERPDGSELEEVEITNSVDLKLGDVCVNVGNRKRNNFTILEKDNKPPVKFEEKSAAPIIKDYDAQEDTGFSASAASNSVSWSNVSTGPNTYSSGYSYAAAVKSDTGYVGLVNQAMTCYLNSLLQSLYMTPEFRNAVYRWDYDGGGDEAARSIPYQLQRLFLQLQTCKKRAVETTDITKSFGWDSSEAWQQHDVQELMRVMFDALEKKWVNTGQADLINQLFLGKMKDYVKCLECGYESARTDCFLDIPLTIRPFGSNQAYGSVEESLAAFVTPEILNEGNQYFCEKCNKKCDAHKGLKFTSFPYLLTMQLKRFDFDYTTMHRIKLNHRMTFPDVLNVNHLIDELRDAAPVPPEGSSVDCAPAENIGCSGAANGDEALDEGIEVGCSAASCSQSPSSAEAAANHRNYQLSAPVQGPYVYELYSIMIHSGSAAGGHYYAYIHSFKDGQWYSFNDQHVSPISIDDIRKTYGGHIGSRGYYSSSFASSTNAYMLVYRQMDKNRNEEFISEEALGAHLKRELDTMQSREEEEQRRRELEKATCRIKLYCFHPILKKNLESKLEVHKDATLAKATEIAWKQFELKGMVPLDCVRLVKYDEYNDYIERSFDGEDATPMGELLDGVKSNYAFELFLEVRTPGAQFITYKPGGVTVKVFVVDLEREHICAPVSLRAHLTQTVSEFMDQVSATLQIPRTNMRCVLERFCNELRLMRDPDWRLKGEGFVKSNKVFVECSGLEAADDDLYPSSRLARLLDRYEHTIRVIISLPPYVGHTAKVGGYGDKDAAGVGSSQTPLSSSATGATVPDSQSNESDEGIGEQSESEFRTHSSSGDSKPALSVDSPTSGEPLPGGPLDTGSVTGNEGVTGNDGDGTGNGSGGTGSDDMHAFIDNAAHRTKTQQQQDACGDGSNTAGVGGSGVVGFGGDSSVVPVPGNSDALSQEDSESTVTSLDSCSTVTSSSTVTLSEPPNLESVAPNLEAVTLLTGASSGAALGASEGSDPLGSNTAATTNGGDAAASRGDTWAEDGVDGAAYDDEYRRYFSASIAVSADSKERNLTVYVDKRITVRALKKQLEPYVGTNSDNFKLYKVYNNTQEFECVRPTETMSSLSDDNQLLVKLGRALRAWEVRVKVYHMLLDQPDPVKLAFEVIVGKSMTVAEVRRMCQQQLHDQCGRLVPIDRLRIRKKSWKAPSTIFIDQQKFDQDIHLMPSTEFFIEELGQPERILHDSQRSVYVRRWSPCKYEVGPFEEVIMETRALDDLKWKVADLSGIPLENVEIAKATGTFPCESSVLNIHTELDWNPNVTELTTWPLSICDDGCVIYYRDKTEELAELGAARKKELQQRENIRLAKNATYTTKFTRKEKALKIYTDDAPSKSRTVLSSTGTAGNTEPLLGPYTRCTQVHEISQPELD